MQEIKRGEVRVRWGERECEWRGERRMGKKEEKKIKSDWVCVCVTRATVSLHVGKRKIITQNLFKCLVN
jgi:hypothetical protein